MMKRFTVVLLSLCIVLIASVAIVMQVAASAATKTAVVNKSPQAIDIIHKQEQFIFTDGSSSYIFKKDGTFKSYPLERFTGRTIEGTWQVYNQGFLINGVWSWLNGISAIDDRRKMTLTIYPRKTFKTVKFLQGADENKPIKIYDCYFEIEELVKVPKKSTPSSGR